MRECIRLLTLVEGRTIQEILGYPDDLKFRSSLTLFACVTPDDRIFQDALDKFYGGEYDAMTLERL